MKPADHLCYPAVDPEQYLVVRASRTPGGLCWRLFPLFFINELILGRRYPQVYYQARHPATPEDAVPLYPCPHCQCVHDGRLWFVGHWFGLLCPSCGGRIPELSCLGTVLVRGCTVPLWLLPARWLRPRWEKKERQRLQQRAAALRDDSEEPFNTKLFLLKLLVVALLYWLLQAWFTSWDYGVDTQMFWWSMLGWAGASVFLVAGMGAYTLWLDQRRRRAGGNQQRDDGEESC